jgi:glucose/arabinose dehydrogenase
MKHRILALVGIVSAFLLADSVSAQLPDGVKSDLGPNVPAFKVRPGYRVTRAAAANFLPEARFLEMSDDGKTLFVSDRENGVVYALTEPDADGIYQKKTNFVTNQRSVQGMDYHGGWLYFSMAAEGSVSRAKDEDGDGKAEKVEVVLPAGTLPRGGGHPFEGLLVTDTDIYVTSSDPTNMTEDINSDRKKIYVFDQATKTKKVFVSGVRNNEKLRFRPGTTEIWGFDHGSDQFGATYGETGGGGRARGQVSRMPFTDLNPPEELNLYVQDGFYGHPYVMGNGVPRPEFSKREDIVDLGLKTTQPKWLIHAHWAVLGFTFIEKDYFPGHKGDLFFASHGSWNSSTPVGAVVQRVLFDQVTGLPYGSQTIVDCQGPDRRFARPVDLAEAPDGTLLFTSDEPAALYRISRSAP